TEGKPVAHVEDAEGRLRATGVGVRPGQGHQAGPVLEERDTSGARVPTQDHGVDEQVVGRGTVGHVEVVGGVRQRQDAADDRRCGGRVRLDVPVERQGAATGPGGAALQRQVGDRRVAVVQVEQAAGQHPDVDPGGSLVVVLGELNGGGRVDDDVPRVD